MDDENKRQVSDRWETWVQRVQGFELGGLPAHFFGRWEIVGHFACLSRLFLALCDDDLQVFTALDWQGISAFGEKVACSFTPINFHT